MDHRNINAKDVETIDAIESESEDDDDDELIALPVEFAEHDDSAGSQDEIMLATRCKEAMMMSVMMMYKC